MVDKRAAHVRRILAGDMAFTNVLGGIAMLFFESIWIVIMYDSGKMVMGQSLGGDIQMIAVALIVLLTSPYLLASLFLASSMAEAARMIVGVCGLLIGLAAAVYAVGFWLEIGPNVKGIYAISRLPWVMFGIFVLWRLRKFKTRLRTMNDEDKAA